MGCAPGGCNYFPKKKQKLRQKKSVGVIYICISISENKKRSKQIAYFFLELLGRLELPTSSLPMKCSTT